MELTSEQLLVQERVNTAEPGSMITLRGFAGTGKTVTASQIIRGFSQSKQRVLVMAPTAAALAVLKGKLNGVPNVDFKTLSQVLQQPEPYVYFSKFPDTKYFMTADDIESLFSLLRGMKISTDGLVRCQVRSATGKITTKAFEDLRREENYDGDLVVVEGFESATVDTRSLNGRLRNSFDNAVTAKFGDVKEDTDFVFKSADSVVDQTFRYYRLLVVDEYSMVSKEMSSILAKAVCLSQPYGAVMLVCGDAGQLQPVNAEINEQIKAVPDDRDIFELDKILRSTDNIAKLASDIRGGLPMVIMMNRWPDVVSMSTSSNEDHLFKEHHDLLLSADVVLTFKNSVVDKINQLVRLDIGKPEMLDLDDKIVCSQNAGYFRGNPPYFVNGELYTIEDLWRGQSGFDLLIDSGFASHVEKESLDLFAGMFNADKLVVAKLGLRDGTVKRAVMDPYMGSTDLSKSAAFKQCKSILKLVYPKTGFEFCDAKYAYAMTVHKAQGSEWDNVVYIVSDYDMRVQKTWHAPYTAVTRAKSDIKIIYWKH